MHEWVNKYHMGAGPQKQFLKIGALKNFAIFIGKHLCWNLFLIKL